MTILSMLRKAGAQVRIADSGGLALKGAPAELLPRVKAESKALMAALKREKAGDVRYEESALYWRLNDMFVSAKRLKGLGVKAELCDRLIAIVFDIEKAAIESMAEAGVAIAKARDEVLVLLPQIREACAMPAEGKLLESLARSVFGAEERLASPPIAKPAKAVEAPRAPADFGAFAPAPGSEQGAMAL